MSQWATALKIGTTALVLDLIERGQAPEIDLAHPIEATKSISRDQSYDWIIELRDGRKISAIDVQRLYLRAAQKAKLATTTKKERGCSREWENVLNDLERDVSLPATAWIGWRRNFCSRRLREARDFRGAIPWLQSIDLEYHNVSPELGLFYDLMRQGEMRRVVSDEEIKTAIFMPPETTRAFFRGRAVAKFNHAIDSIQWDEIVFDDGTQSYRVRFPEVANDQRLESLNQLLRAESPLAEFLRALPSE